MLRILYFEKYDFGDLLSMLKHCKSDEKAHLIRVIIETKTTHVVQYHHVVWIVSNENFINIFYTYFTDFLA